MNPRTLTLDKKIYRAGAIEASIRDYSGIADFRMEKKDHSIIVIIENWQKEYEDTIEYEFCNYLLWKMRN